MDCDICGNIINYLYLYKGKNLCGFCYIFGDIEEEVEEKNENKL